MQFNNVIGLRNDITAATKFTYLKSYLRCYAAKLIQHLQVTEDNYVIAFELLKNEFMDKQAVINELFKKTIGV